MSCNCLNKTEEGKKFVCTCDEFVHPMPLSIGAGLKNLPRQIAGFPEFRRAMLRAVGEKAGLEGWRAREKDDLGVMLLEMWAYVCDSLSFYDKVIAQETYLNTANLRPSLRKLVALLGYLPAPATGSFVNLNALAEGRSPLTIPAGTAFRSGSFSGNPPQVFETNKNTLIHPLTNKWTISAIRPEIILQDNPHWLLIEPRGEIKLFTKLFLLDYSDESQNQVLKVRRIESYTGADDRRYTKLIFEKPAKLRKGTPLSRLWLLLPDPGSLLGKAMSLLESKNDHARRTMMKHAEIDGLHEVYDWSSLTGIRSADEIVTSSSVSSAPRADLVEIALRYRIPTAGTIVNEYKQTLSPEDRLMFEKRPEIPTGDHRSEKFVLTDKNLKGVLVNGNVNYENSELRLNMGQTWQPDLVMPVDVFGNLLDATRGETVRNEILGSGNAIIVSQQFKLKKKPLTYLLAPSATNDRGVQSTLRVYVNGVRWKEVSNFFGIAPIEEVYIVRQDDQGESFVIFGDGVRGKRLPSGTGNVTAYYRFGAGKANPPAGSITQIQSPLPGLGSINNPVAAAGGSDAENAENLRANGPKSALILGRAVSIQDMEAISLATPGVRTVQAEWHWHGVRQCPVVYIWYIGESGIAGFVAERLRSLSDPSTPIVVEAAQAIPVSIGIDIEIDPRYIDNNVLAEVRRVLATPVTGLLSLEKLGIGKPLFRSRIFEQVISVAGVVSVNGISWDSKSLNVYAKKPNAGFYFDFEKGEILLNGNK